MKFDLIAFVEKPFNCQVEGLRALAIKSNGGIPWGDW